MSIQRLIEALSCSINYKRKDPEDSQWYVIIDVVKKILSITSQGLHAVKSARSYVHVGELRSLCQLSQGKQITCQE